MSPATELRPFGPTPDLTVLAAVERAQVQGKGRGKPTTRCCVATHLGFVWNSGTARALHPQLLALESAGCLELGSAARVRGAMSFNPSGLERAPGRAPSGSPPEASVEALPESPQHRTWRHARTAAAVEISEFLGAVTAEVQEAETVLLRPRLGSSGELMQIGNRLQLQFWRLASATYCLREWPEPNERRRDTDKLGRSGFCPFPRRELARWPDEGLFGEEGGLLWRR